MTATIVPEAVLHVATRLLAREVGLRLDPSIQGRLSRCLVDDAVAHGLDVSTYVARLELQPALVQSLLDRVTVQETSFFRDANQFAALRGAVLSDLPGPVSMWSAGCANGQEAYSLAMTLTGKGRSDWRVTASDISTRAVERARRAQYSTREMAGVSSDDRARFFSPAGADWRVVNSLRERVDVVHHNLVSDPPPLQSDQCDIVFCRNVLIYFRDEDVAAFVSRLASWMRPGSWLFLGYSESLWQVSDAFQLVRLGEAFAYRRRPLAQHHYTPAQLAVRKAPRRAVSDVRRRHRSQRDADRPIVARAVTRSAVAPAIPEGDATALAAAGETALRAGDVALAVTAFRKCAFLRPDEPVAHLHLGLALEAAGDRTSARRAYGAARRALSRSDRDAVGVVLDGYNIVELERLLDTKLDTAS